MGLTTALRQCFLAPFESFSILSQLQTKILSQIEVRVENRVMANWPDVSFAIGDPSVRSLCSLSLVAPVTVLLSLL
eukprot:4884196-Pleurochrysis_carterae.AAC.1